jgi:hypothetical protein
MKYVIAGYGKFGRIALELITKHVPNAELIVVESDVSKAGCIDYPCQLTIGDVTSFLLNDQSLEGSDIVVPMVPFHLAASYILAGPRSRKVALPQELTGQVPNPCRLDEYTVFASRADFMCPDDCPEGDFCSVTGLLRSPLYSALANLHVQGWNVSVQRSFQILPGVGGYPVSDLRSLRKRLLKGLNIVATSCKCHGVLTGVEIS